MPRGPRKRSLEEQIADVDSKIQELQEKKKQLLAAKGAGGHPSAAGSSQGSRDNSCGAGKTASVSKGIIRRSVSAKALGKFPVSFLYGKGSSVESENRGGAFLKRKSTALFCNTKTPGCAGSSKEL
jgi:hypothetical protein